jgi:hypothetical protein
MICGVPPFTGDDQEEVFAAIHDFEHTLTFPDEADDVSISPTAVRVVMCVV